jgi:hypothetical protein
MEGWAGAVEVRRASSSDLWEGRAGLRASWDCALAIIFSLWLGSRAACCVLHGGRQECRVAIPADAGLHRNPEGMRFRLKQNAICQFGDGEPEIVVTSKVIPNNFHDSLMALPSISLVDAGSSTTKLGFRVARRG